MTTWPGNTYWFSTTAQSFIAYRVIGGIALTLGPRSDQKRPKEQRSTSSTATAPETAGPRADPWPANHRPEDYA